MPSHKVSKLYPHGVDITKETCLNISPLLLGDNETLPFLSIFAKLTLCGGGSLCGVAVP